MSHIVLGAPLQGEWRFVRPPGHHPDAFDFVRYDADRRALHRSSRWRNYLGSIPSSEFFAWGEPVLAPIDGRVIRVGSDWPDHESTSIWATIGIWYNATFRFRPQAVQGRIDIRPNAGNFVMLESEQGYIVFLAHLMRGSILVTEGRTVECGEVIARVGDSGNSTMPHLHVNVFDQMDDPLAAQVLPCTFEAYRTLRADGVWREATRSLPSRGDFVRFE